MPVDPKNYRAGDHFVNAADVEAVAGRAPTPARSASQGPTVRPPLRAKRLEFGVLRARPFVEAEAGLAAAADRCCDFASAGPSAKRGAA
jgi:hypothetical protein